MVTTLHEHPMFINTKTFFLPSGCRATERLSWSDFKSGQPATENPVFALGSSLLRSRKNACPKLGGRCVFSRFDQKQTTSRNRQNSVTGTFHLDLIFSCTAFRRKKERQNYATPILPPPCKKDRISSIFWGALGHTAKRFLL